MKYSASSTGNGRHASSTARHPKRHGNRISKVERKAEKKHHKEVTVSKIVKGNEDTLRLKRLAALLERQEVNGAGVSAAATAFEAADVQHKLGEDDLAVTLLYKALQLDPQDASKAHVMMAPLLLSLGRTEEVQALLEHWGGDHDITLEISRLLLAMAVAPLDVQIQAFTTAYAANWHAVMLLAAADTEGGLAPTVARDERPADGGIEEALLTLPRFRGWSSWDNLQGKDAWLAAAVLRQPPPANTNGRAGDGRKVVARFEGALDIALEELQRRQAAEAGEEATA